MCVYSVIAEDWSRRNRPLYPWVEPVTPVVPPATPSTAPTWPPNTQSSPPTREEFESLKREVLALRELLKAAKIYDEQTGQPDCEVEEKIAWIKKAAELVNLDLSDVLPEGA